MKWLLTLIILVGLAFLSIDTNAQPPYQIKSAKIIYKNEGDLLVGKHILIFTDSGRFEKQTDSTIITSFSVVDTTTTRNPLYYITIMTKDSVMAMDLLTKRGTVRERIKFELPNPLLAKVGEELVLGRLCEIYEFQITKLWKWKGLVLRQEITIPGEAKSIKYAVEIDENYKIEKNEFQLPGNVILE